MKKPSLALARSTLPLAMLALTVPAWAERADRDKPINLEADRITIDDAKKAQVLQGNVHLVQGTLVIRAEKLVVTQNAAGFQKGVAHAGGGRLASFRQKREGKDEFVEGEGERIEYDATTEKVEFFDKVHLKSGLDEVEGQYASYDGKTESYVVTGSGSKGGQPERVRATIQPKPRDKQ